MKYETMQINQNVKSDDMTTVSNLNVLINI